MKYQTDYFGCIRRDGCLLCSIVTAAEDLVACELSSKHFLDLVDRLSAMKTSYDPACPVLSDELDKQSPGAFIWDHEAVFNEAFKALGSHHRVKYTGRIYMPWENKESFGERGGDILILQIKTPNGGHFRLPNFDPWRGGTKMVDLKSLRYYSLV